MNQSFLITNFELVTQKNAYTVKDVVNDNEMFLRIHECRQKFNINVVFLLLLLLLWWWW